MATRRQASNNFPVPGKIAELVDLVHEIVDLSLHWLQPKLKEEGVTIGEFMAMHIVANIDGVSVSAVAQQLGVSPPTVCVNIDHLEAAGLMRRQRSERDHRAVELSLTPRGQKIEERAWKQLTQFVSEAAGGIPETDIDAAIRVFRAARQRFLDGSSVHGEGR
jgi:DNA-binding MarR family transcriptional regulator